MESNDIQKFNKILPLKDEVDAKSTWKTYFTLGTKQIKYKVVDSEKDMYWDENEQGFVLPNVDLSNKKCFYLVLNMGYFYGVTSITWEIKPYDKQSSIIKVMQNTSSPTSTIKVPYREPNITIPQNTTMASVSGIFNGGNASLSITVDGEPVKGDVYTENLGKIKMYSILNILIKPNFRIFETHIQNAPNNFEVSLMFYSPTNNFKSVINTKFKIMYID